MRVFVASPLRSYTGQRKEVNGEGADVRALLDHLDAQYPGILFRIVDEQGRVRPHVRIFVNEEQVTDLAAPLAPTDEVHVLQALSGG